MTNSSVEAQKFAVRLRLAIASNGYSQSPTFFTRKFNDVFHGRAITSHTARNWILGHSLPRHEKMVCLARMLRTTPEQLRFGRSSEKTLVIEGLEQTAEDQQFFKSYLLLNQSQQRLVRELVVEINNPLTNTFMARGL